MVRFVETFRGAGVSGIILSSQSAAPNALKYVDSPTVFHSDWSPFGQQAHRFPDSTAGIRDLILGPAFQSVKIFDPQPHWYWSGSFELYNDFGITSLANDFIWLIFSNAGKAQLTVRVRNGYLEFWTGGSGIYGDLGSQIAKSTAQLQVPDDWHSLDIVLDIPGKRLELWIDDVLDTVETNVAWGWGALNPDRFNLCLLQQVGNLGYALDAFGIGDGQGQVNNTRLGPVQGDFLPMTDDAVAQWGRIYSYSPPATANFQAIADRNSSNGWPDGDPSYLYSPQSGAMDQYKIGLPRCFGRVLAVALNCCLKAAVFPSPVDLICRPNPTNVAVTNVGSVAPAALGAFAGLYTIEQAITETSLNNPGALWTDGEIGGAYWGIRSSTGQPIVTAFFLEKLVSLRSQSYDCGGISSYAY